jgi:hypothetical protein
MIGGGSVVIIKAEQNSKSLADTILILLDVLMPTELTKPQNFRVLSGCARTWMSTNSMTSSEVWV